MLFSRCTEVFNQPKAWQKARELAYGALTCMGRHTITGMLTASGQQFLDWSSAYRMFSQQRIDISKLFDVASSSVLQELAVHLPYFIKEKMVTHYVSRENSYSLRS